MVERKKKTEFHLLCEGDAFLSLVSNLSFSFFYPLQEAEDPAREKRDKTAFDRQSANSPSPLTSQTKTTPQHE